MNKSFLVIASLLLELAPDLAEAAANSQERQDRRPCTTIHFNYVNGVPFVKVLSNDGTPSMKRFILDTGATQTVSNQMNSLNSGFAVSRSDNNPQMAMYLSGGELNYRAIPLKNIDSCTDLSDISMGCGHWVDGLLGSDYFQNKEVMIDFKHSVVKILNTETVSSGVKLRETLPYFNPHNSVFATVITSKSSRPLHFLVDTGSTKTFIDSSIACGLGFRSTSSSLRVHTVGGNNTMAYQIANFTAKCDGHCLPQSLCAYDLNELSNHFGQRIDGILGTDFLQNYKVHLNFQTRVCSLN